MAGSKNKRTARVGEYAMNIKKRLAKLEKAKQKSPYSDMNREEKIKRLTTLMADHEEQHPSYVQIAGSAYLLKGIKDVSA